MSKKSSDDQVDAKELVNIIDAESSSIPVGIDVSETNDDGCADKDVSETIENKNEDGCANNAAIPDLHDVTIKNKNDAEEFINAWESLRIPVGIDGSETIKNKNDALEFIDGEWQSSRNLEDRIMCYRYGGLAGELLKENVVTMNEILKNLENNEVEGNINLLANVRDNILVIHQLLDDQKKSNKALDKLPPLSVKLNNELGDRILPPPFKN